MNIQPLINYWNGYERYNCLVGPPSSANFVDMHKNPSQQRETLPVPQAEIRLTNVWYGRIDGIMDPLPSKFVVLCSLKLKNNKISQLSESKLFYQTTLL